MEFFFIILLLLLFNTYIIKALNKRFDIPNPNYLWLLFSVHFISTTAYLLYAYATRSDSFGYFQTAQNNEDWFSKFQTGTAFVSFLATPLVNNFSLSYLSTMIIFSYFGFLGIILFYLSTLENITLKSYWNNLTAIELIFLLPNLHFWTSSLGKGSTIVFGLGLFCFGLSRFDRRVLYIILGSFLAYMVRPHIFLVLITSTIVGIIITQSGIKSYLKWLIFSVSVILFIYFSNDVLDFSQAESLDITSSNIIAHRASELSKANSGIDIQNYNQFMKLFTFWFRPLFVDSGGLLGLMASFENLFILYAFFMVIKFGFLSWNSWNGWFRICIFVFMLGSFIMAQVTGNLGIAMRQKAQFLPFLYIMYCKAIYHRQNNLSKRMISQLE